MRDRRKVAMFMSREPTKKLSSNVGEPDTHQELAYMASGTGLMFAGTVFSNVLSLIYGIFVARVIGAKLLGVYFLGISITGFTASLALVGLSNGILRYVGLFYTRGDFYAIRKTIRWVLYIVAISGVLLGFLMFLIARTMAVKLFHRPELATVLALLAVTVPIGCLRLICFSSFQAMRQIKYRVYVEHFAMPISRIALVSVLFLIGWRLMAVVSAYVFSAILGLGIAGYYLRKALSQELGTANGTSEDISANQIMRFSLPLFASSLLGMPANRIAIWLLGGFWSTEAVAIYGVATRLKELGTVVLNSLNTVFAPIISGLSDAGELKKLKMLYRTATRWVVLLSLPIYLLLILLAQKFLNLYGEAFVAGAIPLIVLCLGEIVSSGVGSAGYMIMMSGYSKIHLYNAITRAVLTVVLSFIAIPKYGVLGAAFAVAIPIACVNLVQLIEIYYRLRVHPYDWSYIKPIVSAGVASVILIGITYMLSVQFPYDLMFYSAVFLVVYAGLLFASGLSKEGNRLLHDVGLKLSDEDR